MKKYDLQQQLLADEIINNDLLKNWDRWNNEISKLVGAERVRDTIINRFLVYAAEIHMQSETFDRQHFIDKCGVLYDLVKEKLKEGVTEH